MMQLKHQEQELKDQNTANELGRRFTSIRNRTEQICQPLGKEDFIPQPVVFASPPKWHLAHTTWFFEEMVLKKFATSYEEFNSQFNYLFNSYYQHAGDRVARSARGTITRPTVDDVFAYRAHVDTHMMSLIEGAEPGTELYELIVLGLNHEQQHQELLLTDLKYAFSLNPTFPVYSERTNLVDDRDSSSGWIRVTEGIYDIGYAGEGFCYDNELGRHRVYLNDFEISSALITNGEYLEFIEDGGYKDFRHWLDDGWAWLREEEISAPLYWHKRDDLWHYYTLSGLKVVDPEAAISHISFYEAYAYASWKGYRLPTEFEWESAADKFDWGRRWEWTYSSYLPYPGFEIAEGAVGEYNGKFMINQMVLRGASTATAPGHSRKSYRNFFHPGCRWQVTGIRLAK